MLAEATTAFPATAAHLIFMSMWSQKPTAGTNSALAQPDAISLGDAHAAAEPELSSNKNPLSRMDKIFFFPKLLTYSALW